MLDHINGDASLELAGLEKRVQFTNIAQDQLVVGRVLLRLGHAGRISINSRQMLTFQELQSRSRATTNIQYGSAITKGLKQFQKCENRTEADPAAKKVNAQFGSANHSLNLPDRDALS